jgi:hypothetical protein
MKTVTGRVYSVLPLDVSVLQQTVLSGLFNSSLFCAKYKFRAHVVYAQKIFIPMLKFFAKMTIIAEFFFAKMEKAFCLNSNTDLGLFGR